MDLLERIDAHGRATPERVAHQSGGARLTYGELLARSDALAASLHAELGADGSPVAVLGHKEPELLVAFLGAVKAGHPYVPIDTALPLARVERIVAGAGARLTLTPEGVRTRLAAPPPPGPPPRRVGSDDPFYVMFTSGSTGDPKGVVIPVGSLEAFVTWMLEEQRFGDREVFLDQAPFSFDLSVMDLYPALVTGGTLFSVRRDDVANPLALVGVLACSEVTTWVSTPSFARMCLCDRRFGELLLPRLRRFLFCGETLAPQVAAQLLDRFPAAEVWNTYGPTEATVATTSVRIDRAALERWSPLPVGAAMPGTAILVVGDDGLPVADGERGEIVIAGPNVSTGYLGRPDLNARAFLEVAGRRAYRTGDWGRWRDGLLFFEGRRDHQIKLHGHRIELGDVEANLCALPGVRDAVVLKEDHPERLVAWVIPTRRASADAAEDARALRAELARRVPAYMVPARIRFVDAFPMTVNGKKDARGLAAAAR